MNKWVNMIVGLGVVGAVGVLIPLNGLDIENCGVDQVTLDTKMEYVDVLGVEIFKVTERICLDQVDYDNIKTVLISEYDDKGKEYDFDTNNRELLFLILGKEAKAQEAGMTLLEGTNDEKMNLLR